MSNQPPLISAEMTQATGITAAPSASRFLENQMRINRLAMADSITGLRHAAVHALNPRPWFRHHPAVCISIITAGAGVVSAAIYRRVHNSHAEHKRKCERSKRNYQDHAQHDEPKDGWLKQAGVFLVGSLFRTIRKSLINALMARFMVTRVEPAECTAANALPDDESQMEGSLNVAQ